jgi:phosphopantetheinyl transferase
MTVYYSIGTTPLDKAEQRVEALKLLDLAVPDKPKIAYGEHGKPYFMNSELFFNYSHCKFGAVCALGDCENGVDIQEIRTVRPSLIKRVCCDSEIRSIKSDEDFIRIWVMKEAYSKFTGRGLSEGFRSIDTTAFPEWCVCKIGSVMIGCYNAIGVKPRLVEAWRL